MPASRRHRRRLRAAGAAATGLALAMSGAGCTDTSAVGQKPQKPPVKLVITPVDDSDQARPDVPIVVKAVSGTIQNVTVTTKGAKVEGRLSPDGTEWRSRWTLNPRTAYEVMATGLGADGKTQTLASSFTTLKPKRTVDTTIEAPYDDEKVGVGMPIVLSFDRKVTNKTEVEEAMDVRATRRVEGAWHWLDDQRLVFRTKKYWPRNTKVSVKARMSGVHAGRDVYGMKDLSAEFTVGDAIISTASENRHNMVVTKNGKKLRTVPISMGKGGIEKYTTTNGVHLTMEKGSPVIMDSSTVGCGPGCADYYRQTVYHAVRISNSGEYVHSAPWSVGSQGNSNVSHGCVNVGPSNAQWFYNMAQRGDIVRVTGTSRELEPDNGWGYWQMPWTEWVKGGAFDRSVVVTPTGTVPGPTGSASASPQPSPGAAAAGGAAVTSPSASASPAGGRD